MLSWDGLCYGRYHVKVEQLRAAERQETGQGHAWQSETRGVWKQKYQVRARIRLGVGEKAKDREKLVR